MRIALNQTNIVWEDKEANIAKANELIKHIALDGSDFVVFPEMSFTGFSMNTDVTRETGETIKVIKKIAKEQGISIGFGWVKDGGEKCENHFTILDYNGRILSDYAKIHPFSYSGENRYFKAGNTISTFEIDGIPFCTFICYDLRFPEMFRMVAKKVHAVIIPANWPAKRAEHWKILLRARAIENQVYIFAVNCVGKIGGQYYSGDSCVINPNGDVVKILSNEEGVVEYDFVDDVEEYRNNFPVLDDIVDGSIRVCDDVRGILANV